MKVSAHRAFNLLKELAYERVSCSEAEKSAAQKLLDVAQSTGISAHIEEFPVACGKVNHAKLVVTEPYVKEYEVTGYERAISTPEGGLEADFYYAENLLPAHLEQVRGKIVMINGRLRRADYEKLKKAEVDEKVRAIARKVDLSDEQLKKALVQDMTLATPNAQ